MLKLILAEAERLQAAAAVSKSQLLGAAKLHSGREGGQSVAVSNLAISDKNGVDSWSWNGRLLRVVSQFRLVGSLVKEAGTGGLAKTD